MSFNPKIDTFITLLGKGIILILNFMIVVITTQLWGSEGRGFISIFVADLGLVGIFANIFTGSSVSYYIQRIQASKLASQAIIWIFIVSLIGSIIVFISNGWKIALFLFIIACFSGLIAFNNALFVGKQKIKFYNIITVLQPAFTLLFLLIIHMLHPEIGYFAYFFAYLLATLSVLLIANFLTQRHIEKFTFNLDRETFIHSFQFGWKTELSNLLQFFNYRLTFYLLEYYVGIGSVGIFSIGVTISEAVWIVSRSISLVQYSQVLKDGDIETSRRATIRAAWYSFGASTLCMMMVLILPAQLYGIIFGEEFKDVKFILWILTPGILAIAISNVYGNYFSATGKLNILIIKSLIGLAATISLGIILIPIMKIEGACIVNATAYILSSSVLILYFIISRKRLTEHGGV